MINDDYYNDIFNSIYDFKYKYNKKYDIKTNLDDIIVVECDLHSTKFKVTLKEHLGGIECPKCTNNGWLLKIGDTVGPHNVIIKSKLFKSSNIKNRFEIRAFFECKNCNNDYETRFIRIKNGETTVCAKCSNYKTIKYKNKKIGKIWNGILRRCYDKKDPSYHIYGNIGIGVSNEWLKYENFETWILNEINGDMNKLGKGINKLTLDRIDPYIGYSKENCRLSNPTIQSRNIRYNLILPLGYMGVGKESNRNGYRVGISIYNKTVFIGRFSTKYQCLVARERYIQNNNLEHSRFPFKVKPKICYLKYTELKQNLITKDNRHIFEQYINICLNKVEIPEVYKYLIKQNIKSKNEIEKLLSELDFIWDINKYYYVCEVFFNGEIVINMHNKNK